MQIGPYKKCRHNDHAMKQMYLIQTRVASIVRAQLQKASAVLSKHVNRISDWPQTAWPFGHTGTAVFSPRTYSVRTDKKHTLKQCSWKHYDSANRTTLSVMQQQRVHTRLPQPWVTNGTPNRCKSWQANILSRLWLCCYERHITQPATWNHTKTTARLGTI